MSDGQWALVNVGVAVASMLVGCGTVLVAYRRAMRIATSPIPAVSAPALRVRPDRGACPECGTDEKAWCVDGCGMVDRVDQR